MLTVERLREVLDYNPETGVFRWKQRTSRRVQIGDEAGCRTPVALQIRIDGTLYLAHRLAWLWMTGDWPSEEVDHRDLNPLNNAWLNLREATHGQNNQNVGPYANNRLGLKGVVELPRKGVKRFWARIMVDRKQIDLGVFDTAQAAAAAYAKAANDLHGEFARTAR